MPRNPFSEPAGAALTAFEIGRDDTLIVRLEPFTQSSNNEYFQVVTGTLGAPDIVDYLPVFMETGSIYSISARADITTPRIFITDRAGYGYLSTDGDDIPGGSSDDANEDSIFFFEPDFTGYHFIGIGPENESLFGIDLNYSVTITQDVGGDLVNSLATDIPNRAGDNNSPLILPGQSIISEMSVGDGLDVIRVALTAGKNYVFELLSSNKAAFFLLEQDPTEYTYGSTNAGLFLLTDFPIRSDNDFDILFQKETGGLGFGSFGVNEAFFTPTVSGQYDISILNEFASSSGSIIGSPGTYKFTFYEDQALSTSPTNSGDVGDLRINNLVTGEFFGNAAFPDVADTYGISLTSNTIYQIDLKGASTDSGTTYDPKILRIADASFTTYLSESGSDDAGVGLDSKLTFITEEAGTYYIVADYAERATGTDLSRVHAGSYTLSVTQSNDITNALVPDGVYRFFNTDTGTHFYSANITERDSIIANLPNFNLEGPSFKAADTANGPTASVFRFFNTETGTHFFTQSTAERDSITANLPSFNLEGEAYLGYTEEVAGSTPLYRFFNTDTGTHFYTAAEAEKDSIIENLPSFNFEGTAYWVDPVMG